VNRRRFFVTPLALLVMPVAAKSLIGYLEAGEYVVESRAMVGSVEVDLGATITIEGNVTVSPEWVDTVLIPAIQASINDRDVTLINCSSRQARDL